MVRFEFQEAHSGSAVGEEAEGGWEPHRRLLEQLGKIRK